MSFWNGLKSAFGFGTGDDEEEYNSDIPTYAPKPIQLDQHPAQASTSRPETADETAETPAEATIVTEKSEVAALTRGESTPSTAETSESAETDKVEDLMLPTDLLDAVIERFNSFQPEFVAQCLNIEAERKYLIESISDSLKARVDKVVAASMPKDAAAEIKRLRARVSTLEAQKKTNEELRQENRRLRLSVERQKRSLLDRINDLEAQVAQHFQEKEKFFASRHHSMCSLANQSTPRSEAEGQDGRSLDSLREQLTAALNEAETLKTTIAQAGEREKELSDKLDATEQELERETTMRRQLEDKTSISDAMINTLRNDLAANRKEYEETVGEQQQALEAINEQIQAFEQIKERMETRIAELKDSLKKEKALNRELSEKASDSDEIIRLNDRINELNGLKADLENRISTLTDENASLRHTIETNLYNQANSEMKLRNEIKDLQTRLKEAEEKAVAIESETKLSDDPDISDASFNAVIEASREEEQPKRRKRGRPKKVRVDDDLDNTEWFASQKDNPDFGYHEPPRRPVNDDANQLTLF